ncbi:hypothetical protein POJ06DRAFT_261911 [Lipomyces tetrasporus]|uniref:SMP-30/Gluconolactonase/LRE-like region domain-containing protein n=1 Tax=Lipomyces tetrasporus TaxID=54092 RepID=A0AAD7QMA8_9ASCO|nr:uncharacterized protein POJ06DRAFT_261911 [Lipomyces tetrasporus]KAJ8097620.1 hypothetical protein POJ06DRAFT_261911 [Lipomyces tetrasporus]
MRLPSRLILAATSTIVYLSSTAALNITIKQDVPLAPAKLPAPYAAAQCDEIVEHFGRLGRTTVWNLVEKVHMEGDTFEPEGIVRIGDDRYFLSAGEYTSPTVKYGNGIIINGTDRTAGSGFAHMIVFDGKGKRIADATLTERDAIEYHNGGIDYDGEFIWATIAQYRPNATATLMRIDPRTLEPTVILHVADHKGGVVHDTRTDKFVMLNWGSRNATTWDSRRKPAPYPAFTTFPNNVRNPSYYVDYQDCKFLGHPKQFDHRSTMICSGVASLSPTVAIGGVALVDMETMIPVAEVPITMTSDLGAPVTQNPMEVAIVGGRLRFYFMPDQHNSTLYVYEAEPNSPFEYGA